MFAPKKQPVDQNSLNVKSRQLATNEQARPLPIYCGTARLGTTYIEDVYNWHTLSSRVGNYTWASWAMAIAGGPANKLYKIIWDDEDHWTGDLTFNPVLPTQVLTMANDYGNTRVHMGTAIQSADAILGAHRVHPAYRNQTYVFFNDIFVGIGRTALPNVEFVLGRWPKPSWWTADVDGNGWPKIGKDCNPVAFVAELLQHPIYGLGLPDSRIDTASFNACADTLATEGIGISPIVTQKQGLKKILGDVFAIIDAHLYPLANGKIGMNLLRAPGGGLLALDESKWVNGVQLDPEGWTDTINALTLAYSDADNDYITQTAQFIDRGNFEITGTTRAQTIQRPWITSQALAQKIALSNGARLALPRVRGTLTARKSVAKTLVPGMAFTLTSAEQGLNAVTMRVLEQTLPAPKKDPEITIKFEMDRGYLNADYYAPSYTPPPPAAASAGGKPMLAVEWPWMRDFNVPKILALSGRVDLGATMFAAYKQWPSGSYEYVANEARFAVHGAVADANYPAATNLIDDGIGLVVTLDTLDTTIDNVPLEDALLNEWLVIVGNEICSAFGATLLSAGKYRLYLVRARFDTVREAHAIGDSVWIVKRQDGVFLDAIDAMETQAWKLQQVIDGEPEDLSGIFASTFTTAGRFYRPIEPGNLAAFGDRTNPVYTTGQDVPLTWTVMNERVAGYWDLVDPEWTDDMPDTVLEFWTTGGVLKHVEEIAIAPAGISVGDELTGYTIGNADLVTWFGAEVTFDVRAYHRRNGFKSARYVALRVTKI